MKRVLVARRLAVGHAGRVVLRQIDTFVAEGGSIALVGSNGSGKSTLLKTFAGLIPPIEGVFEIEDGGRRASDSIGYLNQYHRNGILLPLRSIDVVRMARFDKRPRRARRTSADDRAVARAMEAMEIESLAEIPLRDLSGGQQQRVFLAQVLAREAALLLLDEPTAGLDDPGRAAFLNAIESERRRGAAVITATHDVGEAATCDRVLLLAGRLVADGPPDAVLTPENLLATFCVGLTRVHDQLLVTEHVHHDHGGGHGH